MPYYTIVLYAWNTRVATYNLGETRKEGELSVPYIHHLPIPSTLSNFINLVILFQTHHIYIFTYPYIPLSSYCRCCHPVVITHTHLISPSPHTHSLTPHQPSLSHHSSPQNKETKTLPPFLYPDSRRQISSKSIIPSPSYSTLTRFFVSQNRGTRQTPSQSS